MKADSLEALFRMKLPVPPFQVIWSDDVPDVDDILEDAPGPFAVRSSYSEEDGDEASFAGAFLSLLDVPRTKLLSSINKVFKSYRKVASRSEDPDARQCVIVQQMVAADISGVLFTSSPLGLLNEVTLAVADGRCDAIVDDMVEVDLFSFNKDTGDLRAERTGFSSISSGQLSSATEMAMKVEKEYGKPMDVEFAFSGDELFVLQARPVTAMDEYAPVILERGPLARCFPGVSFPLTVELADMVSRRAAYDFLSRLGGKPVMSLFSPASESLIWCVSGRLYSRSEKWDALLSCLPTSDKLIASWHKLHGISASNPAKKPQYGASIRAKAASGLARELLRGHAEIEAFHPKLSAQFIRCLRLIQSAKSLYALNDVFSALMSEVAGRFGIIVANEVKVAWLASRLEPQRTDEFIRSRQEPADIAASFAELAHIAKTEGVGSEAYKRAVYAHTSLHGDWTGGSIKIETKTCKTDPRILHEHVRQMLEHDDEDGDIDKDVVSHEGLVERLLAEALDDHLESRRDLSQFYGLLRLLFRRCGELLAAHGRLEKASDVLFLHTDEIFFRQGDIAVIAQRRRELYLAYPEGSLPDRLVFAGTPYDLFGERVIEAELDYDKSYNDDYDDVYNIMQEDHISPFSGQKSILMRGYGISRGKVRGEVVVMEEPDATDDFHDKIVVAPSFSPEWADIFSGAKALISERGNVLSHAAILIRERRKPAVAGVKEARNYLSDGDTVEVDGLCGTVYLIQGGRMR